MNLFLNLIILYSDKIIRESLISSYTMISAAIFLWITFVILGIIARRFEYVLKKKTQWQFILAAPSGIIVYAILKFYSSVIYGKVKMAGIIEIIAYSLFFLSGVFSFIGALRFRKVISPKKGADHES